MQVEGVHDESVKPALCLAHGQAVAIALHGFAWSLFVAYCAQVDQYLNGQHLAEVNARQEQATAGKSNASALPPLPQPESPIDGGVGHHTLRTVLCWLLADRLCVFSNAGD